MVLEMSWRHVQLNRVSVLISLRENKAMMQTQAPLRVTGGDPESRSGRKETKRVRINVFDGEESDEWVETEQEWVRIHCRPRRDLFSPHDSQGGPELSDISKRRESNVCSTDGGEWRVVDRWGDKESENHKHQKTCCWGDKERPQDLPQDWTGGTRFRKSWEVLCDYESDKQ